MKGGSEMGSANPSNRYSLTKKLLPRILYLLLPVAFIQLYFSPIPPSFSTVAIHQLPPNNSTITTTAAAAATSSPSPRKEEEEEGKDNAQITCDYANGKWVHDNLGPLYNGTSCGTIKEGQNCMSHGRPDVGYLHWRWRPNQCSLTRFEPKTFLQILRNRRLSFVGDSMARNQLESLLCMLSSASTPQLIHTDGEDDDRFRRWHFSSHNATVSIFWSPFLVKGIEKSEGANYNKLYLDSVDERWASDLDRTDVIVLSVGHWFLHPAVYLYGDTALGCHSCEGQNNNYTETEVGFYEVFGRAFKTALGSIIERRRGEGIDVIVTTFSPHHFEGQWDRLGACPRTRPYEEGEKKLEGMDEEMRRVEMEVVVEATAAAAAAANKVGPGGANNNSRFGRVRVEAVDVTKLSLMRPDGHPGPYMYANPFANGIKERVQNDCVHWCLPGPIDTWNEILLDVMKRWDSKGRG